MHISQKSIVEVLKKALGYLDNRLVSHGERVAYIILKMLQHENKYSENEVRDLVFLALIHDIGAYKTEEIDNMFLFEEVRPNDHAVYGYLFIKHFTPLSELSECILFHHIDDDKFDMFDHKLVKLGQKYHFADRVDIVHTYIDENDPSLYLARYYNRFDNKDIKTFSEVNGKTKLLTKLKDGSYRQELNEFFKKNNYRYKQLVDFLIMLAYLIDFKSEFTVTHNINVVTIAEELAKHLRLSMNQVEKIKLAAWLHDVGKIAIPHSILEKKGGLTFEEMETMKQHIRYTEKIISGLVDDEIVNIAIRHHEKLDGSGYYYGLTKKDLTLSDQILAVADIVGALSGKRSYKEAYGKDKIIDILTTMAKTNKINDVVVNEFITNYDEIMTNTKNVASLITQEYFNIKEEFVYYSNLLEGARKKKG